MSEHKQPAAAGPVELVLGLAPERSAFEAWANDQGFPLERVDTFGCEGDYRDLRTHTAWEGFCVGVAAERERCARLCEDIARRNWSRWDQEARLEDQGAAIAADELADAIRA